MKKKSEGKKLVIVESPTKAKTISKFLGSDYSVESSFGHVRDLPKSKMGVDIEHDFAPHYIVPLKAKKRVVLLKKMAHDASDVYFATDEDREGEAISWHLCELLDVPIEKAKRIVFHEITEGAIREALAHPRSINSDLVDAQQARRILDRLVGYELSPFLWRKIAKGLSAGRVQSVALRFIVDREREIQQFKAEEYWTIEGQAHKKKGDTTAFTIKLAQRNGKALDKFDIANEADAQMVIGHVTDAKYKVKNLETKETKKSAPVPFTTSSLQQDANRRLRFSPKQTMMIAQQLYEGIDTGSGHEGLITYMRTDSVNLAEVFRTEAQGFLQSTYGAEYAAGARVYKTKSKLAQEAHEAIRPTSVARTPESVRGSLDDSQFKLYDLIWRRSVGSQMPDARYQATTIDVQPHKEGIPEYVFRASGQTLLFDGFTKVYGVDSEEVILPAVVIGEDLAIDEMQPLQHFTKPPARYSEAGLVKVLEEHGIGRPSTYAPTISTLVERNYVQREERRLKPTEIAFLVIDLLVEHFKSIVDFEFTANMESSFDAIAEGEKKWVPVLRDFYEPFHANLALKDKELSKANIAIEETDIVCEKCGKPMVKRMGRFGKFLACTGFPECKNAKPLDDENPATVGGEGEDGEPLPAVPPCEKCGSPMVMKAGRFGKFLGCGKYPDCKNIRNLRDKNLGIPCPTCGQGTIIQKRSKRGKTFYGCGRYPDCDYVSWVRPGGEGEAVESKKE
ncbi:MAG: type I DNA topoisomerase [bacterium]|nr:type I DNA topoisomerase [bacterium]